MANTEYGDISPRTGVYAERELLKRAIPFLVIEKFGQAKTLPSKKSDTVKFRRYNALSLATTALTEGVTPTAKQLSATDVTATVSQYGDLVTVTDKVMDTHEDPVLQEAVDVLGEQAAQTIETIRFNVLKAGSNVRYANGAARNAVNTTIDLALQRQCVRDLKRQNARPVTKVVRSTASFNTENVAPGYVALVHPDLESDIRGMSGFVPTENYGSIPAWENEIGKVEDVRYVSSTIIAPWADAGGTAGSMISTTGTNADVYPIIFIGRDAYGLVAMKGRNSITPTIVNAKPSDSDPLGQRNHAGWKAYSAAVILNDAWMVRAEVGATD